ncbi:MAG: 5'-3' exonuclease H3TH domain-containing protein, partial [Solirubrobacteraceae bacterium]
MPDELFLIDGNSLAYRAFFALPESIATSTGVPTNAIFGFASMLVKILTDYGPRATVVVWDAGDTGRREVYSEYKAQRTTRPDLLKEQWPHLEPLVDAFGYRNLRVAGYEADDVIASIVEKARTADPPIPVMVVTGDRDAYQLVQDGLIRIMTTSRGITDTRVYDRDGVIDRYGIPPELIPDFIGLKGDTSDNIPGVPGIGDKTAAELLQRFGSLENVLDSVEEISGAKRKQNLTEHADDARLSKQLATAKRDIPLELDLADFVAAEPDRSKLRDTFRQFELREPLRRLEEALGSADAAAPAPQAEQALTATRRELPSLQELKKRVPQTAVAIALRPPEAPEGALFAAEQTWRYGVYTGAAEVLSGEVPRPEDLIEILDPRPVTGHDVKSFGQVPAELAHDTEVAAYLLEPARRGYPFRELCEE